MSGLKAENRFVRINQLEQAVRRKKGGYTEKERQQWLSDLYSCLEAPNWYFAGKTAKIGKKRRKSLDKYTWKEAEFQRTLKQDRERHRLIYTYLTCIRDFNKTNEYYARKNKAANLLAEKLRTDMQQALEKYTLQDPESERIREGYRRVLREVFQEKQDRLNHPVFFLFLPYYLFIELGKCEGLISDTSAFTVPQLSKEDFYWTIRNSPAKVNSEEGYDHLEKLYDLIENTLCTTTHNYGYCSIGQTFLSVYCEHKNNYEYKYPEAAHDQETELEEDKLDYAVDFSVPLWNYDIWVRCFCEQFGTEEGSLLLDIHQLFNLALRPASLQAKRAAEHILQNYADYRIEFWGKSFCLSELLEALCNIYSLQCFGADAPFENDSLRQSTDILMDFLIGTEVYPISTAESSTEEKWLLLLNYGNSKIESHPKLLNGNMKRHLINPSRVLYQTILLHSLANAANIPQRYGLSSFIPYSAALMKLSNGLYRALCSEKAIAQDMAYWGGVKVELDKKYVHTVREAFHVWSVWHMDAAAQFRDYFKYIENNSETLSTIISDLKPFEAETVMIDLSDFESDAEKSDELVNRKQQLFKLVPAFKKIFGLAKNLDDFRYVCILYFLFQALRDRMCRQSFTLCTRLLHLS